MRSAAPELGSTKIRGVKVDAHMGGSVVCWSWMAVNPGLVLVLPPQSMDAHRLPSPLDPKDLGASPRGWVRAVGRPFCLKRLRASGQAADVRRDQVSAAALGQSSGRAAPESRSRQGGPVARALGISTWRGRACFRIHVRSQTHRSVLTKRGNTPPGTARPHRPVSVQSPRPSWEINRLQRLRYPHHDVCSFVSRNGGLVMKAVKPRTRIFALVASCISSSRVATAPNCARHSGSMSWVSVTIRMVLGPARETEADVREREQRARSSRPAATAGQICHRSAEMPLFVQVIKCRPLWFTG